MKERGKWRSIRLIIRWTTVKRRPIAHSYGFALVDQVTSLCASLSLSLSSQVHTMNVNTSRVGEWQSGRVKGHGESERERTRINEHKHPHPHSEFHQLPLPCALSCPRDVMFSTHCYFLVLFFFSNFLLLFLPLSPLPSSFRFSLPFLPFFPFGYFTLCLSQWEREREERETDTALFAAALSCLPRLSFSHQPTVFTFAFKQEQLFSVSADPCPKVLFPSLLL